MAEEVERRDAEQAEAASLDAWDNDVFERVSSAASSLLGNLGSSADVKDVLDVCRGAGLSKRQR